jgi:hypothetical protein
MAWNKIFTDSLLQGYISRITNNLDIRIAMQNKHGTGYNEAGKWLLSSLSVGTD